MKPYKLMVIIGRFQPFHLGHLTVVQQAMAQADHLLILCGSCFQPANLRNPWSFEMRQRLILASVPEVYHTRLTLHPLADLWYQDTLWANKVEAVIRQHMAKFSIDDDAQVACIGFAKDAQSSHLSMLPAFRMIAVQQPPDVHATRIRKACFDGNVEAIASDMVPAAHAVLKDALQSPSWQDLLVTHRYVQQEKSGWQHTPYPPVFTTVDAVVFHRGHVLLVRRQGMPGRGLLALPGGYIEVEETLQDACWRELHEETAIDLPKATLLQHSASIMKNCMPHFKKAFCIVHVCNRKKSSSMHKVRCVV